MRSRSDFTTSDVVRTDCDGVVVSLPPGTWSEAVWRAVRLELEMEPGMFGSGTVSLEAPPGQGSPGVRSADGLTNPMSSR
mmetsp:Transcript_12580/g.34817  ORF Transcript_12580/g.34817 Transcript_12580/m.34817 type:complete len:80 (-) Transcript_12580:732-971(-)